jgi:hypothetical protein
MISAGKKGALYLYFRRYDKSGIALVGGNTGYYQFLFPEKQ